MAGGVSYAGHLAIIFQRKPEDIVTVDKLDAIYDNISKIKTPSCENLEAALCGAKARLDEIKKRIETTKTK